MAQEINEVSEKVNFFPNQSKIKTQHFKICEMQQKQHMDIYKTKFVC